MKIENYGDELLKIVRNFLREQSCINRLEGMFSQQSCAHCDMIRAIDAELLHRNPPSASDFGRVFSFKRSELL